jgi:lipid-A-disaccharide synthase
VFLEAYALLRRHFPDSEALVFAAPGLPDSAYDLRGVPRARLVREADFRLRGTLDVALCSSGTATLENALLGVPMVVVYKLSWPTYAVARAIAKVRHIAMANILAGKALVPELIQSDATPEKVARAALELLEDPRRYARLRAELLALRAKLGAPGGAERAARSLLRELLPAGPGAAR